MSEKESEGTCTECGARVTNYTSMCLSCIPQAVRRMEKRIAEERRMYANEDMEMFPRRG